MPDTTPGADGFREDQRPIDEESPRGEPSTAILKGIVERRDSQRTEVRLSCSVVIGAHAHEGFLRDVSPGGAMVHGLRGVLLHDMVRLRVPTLTDRSFAAEVRAISLTGYHLALTDAREREVWRKLVEHLLPEDSTEA